MTPTRRLCGTDETVVVHTAGLIVEDVNAAERSHMLAKLPSPARVVLRVYGERRTRKATANFRRDLPSPVRQNETVR